MKFHTPSVSLVVGLLLASCASQPTPEAAPSPTPQNAPTVAAPVSPEPAPVAIAEPPPADLKPENHLTIHADQGKLTVSRHIYGHFAEHLGRCIYEGIWVGEDSAIPNTRGIRNDVVAALKGIQIPVLRWPGGCFADEYHWKDGVGPREKRPSIYNSHWGGVVENNHFGTHEFMDLVEQLGCEAYICGNVGSGTVQEMMEWVEYLTSDADSPMANQRRANGREKAWRVKYFGVGNESWGCGGNMTPQYYANEYKRYNTFVKNYNRENPVERFACGANSADYRWTEVLMADVGRRMNGLSLHYYTVPRTWQRKGSATDFTEADWHQTLLKCLEIKTLVQKHGEIMDKADPQKRVGMIVDEWGTWYDVEPGTNPGFLYQQNTLRDALVAGISLNIFNQHCDRVKMANIAQTINVLQAMILTDKEKMLLTPTYHVFEMYTPHHDATLLPTDLKCADYTHGTNRIPALSVSASKARDGGITITLCNLNPTTEVELTAELPGVKVSEISGRILTAPTIQAHNTFAAPETVKPADFTGIELRAGGFVTKLPARSVVRLSLK
jgi:alpha-N-arabinofuranosidase